MRLRVKGNDMRELHDMCQQRGQLREAIRIGKFDGDVLAEKRHVQPSTVGSLPMLILKIRKELAASDRK